MPEAWLAGQLQTGWPRRCWVLVTAAGLLTGQLGQFGGHTGAWEGVTQLELLSFPPWRLWSKVSYCLSVRQAGWLAAAAVASWPAGGLEQ